ncbi:P-loop containing nucleoside triphosphate hydrolase [Cinara cedri]|uniref:P-loop containing nucleoside triphosphate hydrolase n=1 Tax=Cinara cedri TaxID=506608 RepID=A0A5E4LZ42_9HEMI|nr:P-loop containing nucleoside triphosphate hydrolase [Cinara cedri]
MSPEKKAWIKPFFGELSLNKPKDTIQNRPKLAVNNKRTHAQSEKKNSDWCNTYIPQSVSKLAVHSGKIKEVQIWFESLDNKLLTNSKFLLVSGPSGCSKATAVRLIAKHCGFTCLEWITPMSAEPIYDQCTGGYSYESVQERFQDFIWGATRYRSLNCGISSNQFLLIKDIPNVFLDKPDEFHNIMSRFNSASKFPIVFIVNNEKLVRNLFPTEILEKFKVQEIKFNPITRKSVLNVLGQIIKAEQQHNKLLKVPNSNELNTIYEETNGDLRSAIIHLSFNCMNVQNKTIKTSSTAPKNEHLDLFHSIGRVLYPKRELNSSLEFKFTHNPDNLIEQFAMQPSTVLGFLQENYLTRFSSLIDVCEGADAISAADVMLSSNFMFGVSIYDISLSSLSVAVRGLMLANRNPIKTFRSIVKPKHFQYTNDVDIYHDIKRWFDNEHESPKNILLDLIPFVNELGTDKQKEATKEFCRFKRK